MIFKELVIENFGLYSGRHTIQLAPNKRGNRNITLIYGQNGVGKSTVQEVIQLGILGPFYLGERTANVEYEKYLFKRCHKNPEVKNPSQQTKIEINLSYTKAGTSVDYKFVRSWYNNSEDLDEKLSIFENEKELKELDQKERNLFIRELIPPGFAKVMFFDGEKLQSMNENSTLNSFIADCCHSLFGLNLVNILQKDIELYSNKLLSEQKNSPIANEIHTLTKEIDALISEKEMLTIKHKSIEEEQEEIQEKISVEEINLAEKGRWVAEKMDDMETRRNKLVNAIENDKKALVEIFSALGPFSVAKDLCLQLKKKLQIEKNIEKWKNAEEIIKERIDSLEENIDSLPIWSKLKIKDKETKDLFIAEFKNLLSSTDVTKTKVVHELTETERNTLELWIDSILNELPKRIELLTVDLEKNEQFLSNLNKERATFSNEDDVKTILKTIQELNHKMGSLENEKKTNSRKIDEVSKRIEFYTGRKESALKKSLGLNDLEKKLKLSSITKTILEEYTETLLDRKLKKLEKVLLEKFNILCRKTNYFDKADIDRKTFNVNLYKGKQEVSQAHLSAGEKQILALSMLWALHSISNISLPMVIDTPVARLDKKHRNAIIKELLPNISEQVIVLGTETELSIDVVKQLMASLNNYYELKYDSKNHSTKLYERDAVKQLEELEV
jgi:DNA sulfur modification protein DndD